MSIEVEVRMRRCRTRAEILARNGADARSVVEKVLENNRFVIRILMQVGYEGKNKLRKS
jgi:hypothetical protein